MPLRAPVPGAPKSPPDGGRHLMPDDDVPLGATVGIDGFRACVTAGAAVAVGDWTCAAGCDTGIAGGGGLLFAATCVVELYAPGGGGE